MGRLLARLSLSNAAAGLQGGRADPRAAAFTDRMEADVAARLAAAPERMLIPLAKLLLVKEEPELYFSPSDGSPASRS